MAAYLGAWPRRGLEEVGLFDENLHRNQDDELAMRIRAAGGKLLLAPRIHSSYRPRESLLGIWRQHFGYGFYKPRVLRRHCSGMRPRHLAPPLLVLLLVIWPLWAGVAWAAVLSIVGLRGIVALGAGAVMVPPVAAAMQLAYGIGFLCGLPWIFQASRIGRFRLTSNEGDRIRDFYRSRDAAGDDSPAFLRYLRRAEWRAFSVLRRASSAQRPLEAMRVLEVGCGRGGWLPSFLDHGAKAENLAGVDLSEERIEGAREALPGVDLRVGCATDLPFADKSFDLIVLSTVISSVLDEAMLESMIREARRVGDELLIHDMRVVKGGAPLRPLNLARLRRLLGKEPRLSRRSILAPPLSRPLSRISVDLCQVLETIPCLCSHLTVLERVES